MAVLLVQKRTCAGQKQKEEKMTKEEFFSQWDWNKLDKKHKTTKTI